MKNKIYSFILVFLQFIFIVALLLLNDSIFTNRLSIVISGIGFCVGIYAITVNKLSNFNITPEIKENAELITTGAYKYIRHPMYLAVLLIMFGVLITGLTILSSVIYLLLVFVLYLKAKKEESLWMEKIREYEDYQKTTKMFIPFIL